MSRQSWKITFKASDSFRDRTRSKQQGAARPAVPSLLPPATPKPTPPSAPIQQQAPPPPQPPAADDTPPTCARGDWCYGRRITTVDGKVVITPAFTPRAYCEKCWAHICDCLSELPSAYGRLRGELAEASRRGDPVHIPFGPRLPLRENIDALMRLMAVTLCGWEARVRAQASLAQRDPGKPVCTAASVRQAVDTLTIHQSVLLALQPAGMVRSITLALGRHGKPAVISDRHGELIERLAPVADTDIVRLGVDYIATMVDVGAEDAGRDILRLHARSLAILGEVGQQAEALDGVPCRRCEDMALERAEPPSDPALPVMWSQCASCRDQMNREDFTAWAAMYAKWADGSGLTCSRCQQGRHGECIYSGCACPAPQDHAARRAVA